jgi:hypothetical protein
MGEQNAVLFTGGIRCANIGGGTSIRFIYSIIPLKFELDDDSRNVAVPLTILDLEGNLLVEKIVRQIFKFENVFTRIFEISDAHQRWIFNEV